MTVDVTKLACKYVESVLSYLKQSSYLVEPCLDNVTYWLLKYKQIITLEDCLTYEEQCTLFDIANGLPPIVLPDPVTHNCAGLVNITLTAKSVPCNYTVSLQNKSGIASAFPVISVEEDTIYQPGLLDVKIKGCNEEELIEVSTGCVNISNLQDPVCSAEYSQEAIINFRFKDMLNNTSGYINSMVIYETDADGLLLPTPITLNLAPSNLTAWVACPLCSGISPADLYFGSPNWATAFKELLDNVSYTLHGALTSAWVVYTTPALNILTIGNMVKHAPSGKWMGIDKNNYTFAYVNDSGILIKNVIPSITYSGTTNFMADDFSIAMDCGTVSGRVVMTSGTAIGFTQSNFINYVVDNPVMNKPAIIVNLVNPSCTKTTLTATYSLNVIENIEYVEWGKEGEDPFSNEDSVIVTESGTYYFRVTIGDGCIAEKTITV